MKNTRITYLYRDASNYKRLNEAVVEGSITEEQIDSIMGCLECGEYFIPNRVGLPETRFEEVTSDDHCWFELHRDGFSLTDEEENTGIDVYELVNLFLRALDKWEDDKIPGGEF